MSDSNSASPNTHNTSRRRPWTTPQLAVHDSMMVLTQSFFGVTAATMLLQGTGISCTIPPQPGCT